MPRQGAEALFGMRPALEDQLAQGGGSRTNGCGFAADARDRPISVEAMARRHVLRDGGVPVVAAGALMRGDALAPEKDFDGLRRQPHLDLTAGEAVRDAVVMVLDRDVVIDARPAAPAIRQRHRARQAGS